MIGPRKYPRYPVGLRLRLGLPGGELETTTEEISLAGFSARCTTLPESGTEFTFTAHLPDGTLISGKAAAVRLSADGLAGFSCEFAADQLSGWNAFIEQEHAQGGLWRMLSRWVTSGPEEANPTRSVRERTGRGVMRFHMVGENGEAYRVAFEKHPSEPPGESAFARASPKVLEFAKRTVSRILLSEVLLKRSPQAEVESVRLVEMLNGGFGYLVEHPGGKPGLMGLHGGELIAVERDGQGVFPHFTADDLERIAADTFRRADDAPKPSADRPSPPLAMREERFADSYEHQHVDTQQLDALSQDELRAAIAGSQRVQKRTYGERTLRLFPDVWLELQADDAGKPPLRGFAMEDGPSLCVFVLVGQGAPRVRKLGPADRVFGIRVGQEGR